MATIVFLISRCSRSKSEAAKCIKAIAKQHNLPVSHISDYPILYRMYQEDMQKLKFQPADPQRPELGFTIIDPSVMVVAFQQLQRQIQEIKQQSGIVLVELADDDYKLFFEQLQPESCQNRHILFFEAELEAKNTRHTKEFLEQVKTYVKQKVIPQALL